MNFQKLLRDLDACPDNVADEYAAGIVNQVSAWAKVNGHAALVRDLAYGASRLEVARYLADAIATVKDSGGPYSVVQAAAILGVSKEMVYKLCAEGDLAHVRVGSRITIADQQLSDYQAEAER